VNSLTTVQKLPSSLVASSIIPIISAIPTGSFAPDSPFRIVPVRPRISRPPRTEKVTAGSVGARAAPSRPLVVQVRPSSPCAASAISPAVAKVPSTPSERIGTAALRNRRQPMSRPPSKRITISATTPIRSTVTNEIASCRPGKRSEAAAAPTRNKAALGIAKRCVIARPSNANEHAAETTRTITPKSEISVTRVNLWPRGPRPAAYTFLT
jgi:hypothetical protein